MRLPLLLVLTSCATPLPGEAGKTTNAPELTSSPGAETGGTETSTTPGEPDGATESEEQDESSGSTTPGTTDTGSSVAGTSPTSSSGSTPPVDTATTSVDCSVLEADYDVCSETPTTCSAVFENATSCTALCASAGLACAAAYDNIDGSCAADFGSPVDCDSGHQSDYCQCEGEVDLCDVYPQPASTLLSELVGFGEDTTGGDPGSLYWVTTLADDGPGSLREGLESNDSLWIVFDVEGEITLSSDLYVASNKTVDGRMRDVLIRGNLRLEDVHDVILTDLQLTNDLEGHCTQDGDVVTMTGDGGADPSDFSTHDIWLHHLEVFNGGDGLVDLRGATNVTISWSHFHTHEKGLLLDTDRNEGDTEGMRVTMHHNFFDRITRRAPQIAHGWLHAYNNMQLEWYEVGVISIDDAQVYSEANIYQARPGAVCVLPCPDPNPCGDDDFTVSKEATSVNWSGDTDGNLKSVDDSVLEGAVIRERNAGSVFDPSAHYTYVAEPTSVALGMQIQDEAGPRDTCP